MIGIIPDQLITECRELEIPSAAGYAVPDAEQDIVKMMVLERHMASGHVGKGFVQGLGLRRAPSLRPSLMITTTSSLPARTMFR